MTSFDCEAVIFDFDGTLVLSNDLKREAMITAAESIGINKAAAESLLDSFIGDRYGWAEYLCGLSSKSMSPNRMKLMVSKIINHAVFRAPLRPGALEYLHFLRDNRIAAFVSSATPSIDLEPVVKSFFSEDFFNGVFGGGNKTEVLHRIHAEFGISKSNSLVIGDGVDDFESAHSFGCRFYGLDGGTLVQSCYRGCIYKNFNELML